MRLNTKQKNKLLSWVAEGLDSGVINKNASKFDPPFSVSRQQVDYYRKTRQIKVKELKENFEESGLNEGLARVEVRVGKLKILADLLEIDLFEKKDIWLADRKGVGTTGEIFDFFKLNKAEMDVYRGILDDIAQEVGGRINKVALTDPTGEKEYGSDVRNIILSKLLPDLTLDGEEG